MSGLAKIAKDKKNTFMCHIARIQNAIRRIIKSLLFFVQKIESKKENIGKSKIEKQNEKH